MSRSKTLLCTVALAASGLLAQVPAPPPLIHLSIVALNASGEPVTDLTASDFKIVDQTKPQTIFAFHKPPEPAAPLAQLEYSNRPAGAAPHATVLLFDMMNMNQADRLDTWKDLDKSLPQLESGESIYFYVLNLEGALVPIHAMGPKSASDKTWPQEAAGELDKAMKAASHGRPVQLGNEDQVKRTYKALEELGNQLAAFPGRRDIVWVTNGVPATWDPKNSKCKSMDMERAHGTWGGGGAPSGDPRTEGQVTDARGALSSGMSTGGDWIDCGLYVPHLQVTLEKDAVGVNPMSHSRDLNPDVNRDLEQMALLTGGHNYYRDSARTVLEKVARAGASTYSIAYDPSAQNWDNKFHMVHVTCERPGVKLQVRERYYAMADSRPAQDRMKAVLMTAFQSPSDVSDIGLRTKIAPAEGGKGVHLEIRINPSDVVLREQGGKFAGAVYLLISDRGAAGALGEPTVSSFNLDLTPEQHAIVLKEGIPLSQDHPTSDAVRQIRLIVLDQNTNASGSLTFPIK